MKKLDPMHSPGEIRDCNPGEPVDDPQDGEDRDAQPPEPEDQKVLLVEEVVREDAKVVAPVYASGCSSNTDIARHLNTTFQLFLFFIFFFLINIHCPRPHKLKARIFVLWRSTYSPSPFPPIPQP